MSRAVALLVAIAAVTSAELGFAGNEVVVLRASKAARALTLLAEQDRQFADGQLGEARTAARAIRT